MIRRARWLALSTICALGSGIAPTMQGLGPMYEWHLGADAVSGAVVKATTGGLDGKLSGGFRRGTAPAHIDFAGSGFVELVTKGRPVDLPGKAITAEAWVNLRAAGTWGGVIGYVQDNGGFERGWVLGNRDARFSFALASQGADDGDGRLTYLTANEDIPLGRWCHVAGTYDGRNLCIYVNGKLSNSTTEQSGDIDYADADLVIGAYKDDNEHFPLNGAIHSVRIYDRTLSPAEVAARYEATSSLFAAAAPLPPTAEEAVDPILIDGPYVTFEAQRKAVVCWSTRQRVPSILEYGATGEAGSILRDRRPKRSHSMVIGDLRRNTEYTYRIRVPEAGGESATREYALNTEFDFSVPDLPKSEKAYPRDALSGAYAEAAEYVLRNSGIDRGYCLDYGCGDGRLAHEIARRSKLYVVGVSTDRRAVETGRTRLIAAGSYGCRVTLRHVGSLDELPFPDLCANLIVSGELVSGGRLPGGADEVVGKLRPEGGSAYIGVPANAASRLTEKGLRQWLAASAPEDDSTDADRAGSRSESPLPDFDQEIETRVASSRNGLWATIRRPGPLPGAGEWTHAYGTPGQTANSGDQLVCGQAGRTLEVQWFGLPGPNAMIDRQVRMQGPVSAAGRIFSQGNNRVIAQDAYNGAILWSMEIPHLRRTNLPRNTGNACASREHLFVAVRDRCWRLDAATGRRTMSYGVAQRHSETPYDWGYVGVDDSRLLGSAVRRGNMDTGFVGPQFWFDHKSGPDTHNVCSDYLFADRIGDGKRLWSYSNGLIVNPTIAMGGGRVYFLESRSPEAIDSPKRKLGSELWGDAWLVALDVQTGETVWQKPFEIGSQPIVVYLMYHEDRIATVSSFGGEYHVSAFDAPSGRRLWHATHQWRSDNHGHHIQHPVIAQDRLFLEPDVYDWRTGEKIELEFPARSKCGTMAGAANLLHYRDYNDEVWDLDANTQSEFSQLRSNCWIGMISGNGLLMSPESGGGCSCQWPIYTSLAYRAKDDY